MGFTRKLKEEFIERPDYEKMKVPELKRVLEELSYGYDLPTTGSKDELLKRIKLVETDKDFGPVKYETINGIHFIGVHKNDEESMKQINFLKLEQSKHNSKSEHKTYPIQNSYYSCNYHFYITIDKIKLQ